MPCALDDSDEPAKSQFSGRSLLGKLFDDPLHFFHGVEGAPGGAGLLYGRPALRVLAGAKFHRVCSARRNVPWGILLHVWLKGFLYPRHFYFLSEAEFKLLSDANGFSPIDGVEFPSTDSTILSPPSGKVGIYLKTINNCLCLPLSDF
ncbi:unnamed protein product [Lactuca saligna]|uniref:Uncharacterized protein n=1 Tax=Lactuca saligna TaxID=75948 RepID=A0AA36E1H5_LACSI|nr:unnamed protein product [Lactuca saligna]